MQHSSSRSCSLFLLLASIPLLIVPGAHPVWAGVNAWTPYGPGGGSVVALAVDPVTPGILYAMTDTREVYKSADRGGTWKWSSTGLPRLNFSAQALALDPAHPKTLYASLGPHLFRSTDGAAHWAAVDTGLALTETLQSSTLTVVPGSQGILFFTYGPHVLTKIIVDPQVPTTLYAVRVGRGIWRSTDGGVTWDSVNAGLTGVGRSGGDFQVLTAHPSAPHTVYVAPALGGVFEARFED